LDFVSGVHPFISPSFGRLPGATTDITRLVSLADKTYHRALRVVPQGERHKA